MKCTIPEISWHNREPVLCVDIHPLSSDSYKLASGGGDSHILIWHMVLTANGSVKQEVVSDLTRHQRSVNSVRWSSTGQYLASADDDANIIVWQLKTDNIPLLEGDSEDKETWIVYKILRGHKEDIYDLCWSTDNTKLLSGSIDNTAIIWDLTKGSLEKILSDHKGFVQGVAWDPKNQLLATISTDRICRIYDNNGKQVKARIYKGKLPVSEEHFLYDKESKYFHDDTFKSFYRRLQFTPDGSLLIVPSGHFQDDDCKRILNSTLIFTIDNWTEPVAVLPLEKQSSTVVRCCPVLFQHREKGPEPIVKLPYRIVFAIGTDHDIILYDTQQSKPFARFHEIHYTRITDITWSKDGLLLIASSTDGFCSLVTFEVGELGEEYVKDDSDEEVNALDTSETVEINEKDENIDINNKNIKEKELPKRPSFLLQWAKNPPKMPKAGELGEEYVKNNSDEEISPLEISESVDVNEKDANIDINNKHIKEKQVPKRPSFLLQWAKNPSKIPKLDKKDATDDEVTIIDEEPEKNLKEVINKLIPRRSNTLKDKESSNVTAEGKNRTPSNENVLLEKEKDIKPKEVINKLTPRRTKLITVTETNSTKESSSVKAENNDLSTSNEILLETEKTKKPEVINKLIPRRINPVKVKETNSTGIDKNKDSTTNNEIVLVETNKEKNSKTVINKLIPRRKSPIKNEEADFSKESSILIDKINKKILKIVIVKDDLHQKQKDSQCSYKTNCVLGDVNKMTEQTQDIKQNQKDSFEQIDKITPKKIEETKSTTQTDLPENESNDKLTKLRNESKQKINILIPRRITPIKIGECAQKNYTAKAPGVREAPSGHEVKQTPVKRRIIESTTDNDDDILAKKLNDDDSNNQECSSKLNEVVEITNEKQSTITGNTIESKSKSLDDIIVLNDGSTDLEVQTKIKQTKNLKTKTTPYKIKLASPKSQIVEQNKTLSSTSLSPKNNSLSPAQNLGKKKINKNKHNATPIKSNTLLNFLQKSREKHKKDNSDTAIVVDLTEDNEAQDGFNKETKKSEKDCNCLVTLDEEITEDFSLQLEDTIESTQLKESKDIDKEEVTGAVSDTSSLQQVQNIQKKPRRVPLITLSSPKGKNRSNAGKPED